MSGGTVASILTWMPSNPRRLTRHDVRNHGAPVPTLRYVTLVSQTPHQFIPGARHTSGTPACGLRLARKAIAGHRGHNKIEGVFGAATLRCRIAERSNYLEEFTDRAWPPFAVITVLRLTERGEWIGRHYQVLPTLGSRR